MRLVLRTLLLSPHVLFWLKPAFLLPPVGFVIHGVRIPLPKKLNDPLVKLLVRLRLRDPTSRRQQKQTTTRPASPPVPQDDALPPDETTSTRPSLRNRSESKVGVESATPIGADQAVAVEDETEQGRLSVVLDLRAAPVVGVVLLLITTTIDGSVLRHGIVGEDGVRPYDVLVLFISLVRPLAVYSCVVAFAEDVVSSCNNRPTSLPLSTQPELSVPSPSTSLDELPPLPKPPPNVQPPASHSSAPSTPSGSSLDSSSETIPSYFLERLSWGTSRG